MHKATVLSLATSALLTASSALAGGSSTLNGLNGGDTILPKNSSPSMYSDYSVANTAKGSQNGEAQNNGRRRHAHRALRMLLRGTEPTEAQVEAIRAISQEAREASREIIQAAREAREAGEQADPETVRAQLKEIRNTIPGQIRDVLTEQQQTVFDENLTELKERRAEHVDEGRPHRNEAAGGRHHAGRALRMLLRDIEPTEAQTETIRAIALDTREASQEIIQTAREAREAGGQADPEAVRAQLKEIREAAHSQIRETLTDPQQAIFDENLAKLKERRAEHREENDRPRRPHGSPRGNGQEAGQD